MMVRFSSKQDTGGVGIATRVIAINANEVGNTFLLIKKVTMMTLDWQKIEHS